MARDSPEQVTFPGCSGRKPVREAGRLEDAGKLDDADICQTPKLTFWDMILLLNIIRTVTPSEISPSTQSRKSL